jgi:hypothetical protein
VHDLLLPENNLIGFLRTVLRLLVSVRSVELGKEKSKASVVKPYAQRKDHEAETQMRFIREDTSIFFANPIEFTFSIFVGWGGARKE